MEQRGKCDSCAKLDLSPLFEAPPENPGSSSLKQLEETRAVWLPEANFLKDIPRNTCVLCKLVADCSYRANMWKTEEGVRCRITPVYAWMRTSIPTQVHTGGDLPQLVHSGKWHVWFYEVKIDRKFPLVPFKGSWPTRRVRNDYEAEGLGQYSQANLDSTGSSGVHRLPNNLDNIIPFTGPQNDASEPRSSSPDGLLRSVIPPRYARSQVKSAIASWTFEAVEILAPVDALPRSLSRVPIFERVDPQLLRTWLRDCDRSHKHTYTNTVARDRLRNAHAAGNIRAINTTSGQIHPLPVDASYVALSYVWGRGPSPESVLSANLEYLALSYDCVQGPSSEEARCSQKYPQTVLDAVEIARQLGFQWIWVDRHCIRQDDEREKALLVPVIKDIFALASLTIVAAIEGGAHVGLPGVSQSLRVEEQPVEVGYESTVASVLPAPLSFNTLIQKSAWKTRGWTFEENVFSRRLLYFFDTEVMLSCPHGTYREAYGEKYSPGSAGSIWADGGATPPTITALLQSKFNADAGNISTTLTATDLVRAIQEYTSRELTFEEDRTKAFAGLVSASSGSRDPVEDEPLLLHGHPLRYFETLLTWHSDSKDPARKTADGRPVAPSWSWASAGKRVQFLDNGEDHQRSCWFQFVLFEGFDVLGVPVEDDIPMIANLNLDPPESIIEQLLQDNPPVGILPAYEHINEPQSFVDSTRLPHLHLVTVTFKVLHCPVPDGNAWIESFGNRESRGYCAFTNTNISGVCTCALVAGNHSMYVMLLRPHLQHNNLWTRKGLFRLSAKDPFVASLMIPIMRNGNAQWRHITIT